MKCTWFRPTWILDSSSPTREIISMHALVNSEKFAFDVHISRMILMARFLTLTPVSLVLSAILSKYCKSNTLLGAKEWEIKDNHVIEWELKHAITQTLKPRSGWEAICLPTSSKAASLTDIAESQNLPSTANWTRLSPNTSGSASTIILTCFIKLDKT